MLKTLIDKTKFSNPLVTAKGEERATVAWHGLKTLWLNTGTLCNIECANCYIESSPRNDRLVYLSIDDVQPFYDEIDDLGEGPKEIGITGGEPFMCPDILKIVEAALERGHSVLLLTNAMRPMMRPHVQAGLKAIIHQYGDRLILRVSLDSHNRDLHDAERGAGAFEEAMNGLNWLGMIGANIAIAGRQELHEDEAQARAAYGEMAAGIGLTLDPHDPKQLVLFPEMVARDDPPEITTACWGILNKSPEDIMCANQRMVIKRKGAGHASVTACTLLVDDPQFELGTTLAGATEQAVALNHPWCATFCVLGGASCSA